MLAPGARQVEGPAGWSSGTWGGVWHWLCDLGKLLHLSGLRTVICKGTLLPGLWCVQLTPNLP